MSSLQGEHAVALARGWLGTPYRHQASLKGVGADCLGLVRGIWRELYDEEPMQPPAYSRDWAEATNANTLYEGALAHLSLETRGTIETGDILLFRYREDLPCKHMAIASSATTMIHAYDRTAVVETSIGSWWQRRIAGIFTFPLRQS